MAAPYRMGSYSSYLRRKTVQSIVGIHLNKKKQKANNILEEIFGVTQIIYKFSIVRKVTEHTIRKYLQIVLLLLRSNSNIKNSLIA